MNWWFSEKCLMFFKIKETVEVKAVTTKKCVWNM